MRFFDTSGRLIATAGNYPEGLSTVFSNEKWLFLKDSKGNDYHQNSLGLMVNHFDHQKVNQRLQQYAAGDKQMLFEQEIV